MTDNQELFDERYRKVLKHHRKLSRGYVTRLGKNGVIQHHPIGKLRNIMSINTLILPFAILFIFKACIITILGEEAYNAQVVVLQNGAIWEQAGGMLMQMDLFSWSLAHFLGSIIG